MTADQASRHTGADTTPGPAAGEALSGIDQG